MVEARISDIEGRLSAAQVIDVTTIPYTGKVIFGTTVTIANVETDEEVTYRIVGEDEAEIKEGKISVTSPIARAMIGKEEDRKSTRLNSSHVRISYAVFCLKKKKKK